MAVPDTFIAVQRAQNNFATSVLSIQDSVNAVAFIAFVVLVVGVSFVGSRGDRRETSRLVF